MQVETDRPQPDAILDFWKMLQWNILINNIIFSPRTLQLVSLTTLTTMFLLGSRKKISGFIDLQQTNTRDHVLCGGFVKESLYMNFQETLTSQLRFCSPFLCCWTHKAENYQFWMFDPTKIQTPINRFGARRLIQEQGIWSTSVIAISVTSN